VLAPFPRFLLCALARGQVVKVTATSWPTMSDSVRVMGVMQRCRAPLDGVAVVRLDGRRAQARHTHNAAKRTTF